MVYCKYCKYKRYFDMGAETWHECHHPDCEIDRHNYYNHWIVHAYCKDINKNNDCKLYEERDNILWHIARAFYR